jgi:trans-2,3-dihydro-3-hydroxyanthranilate isomerase
MSGAQTALRLPLDLALQSDQRDLHRYLTLDVFTDAPLDGNQLGLFTDARELAPETMQRLARELNFAETVFVLPPTEGGDARIRIFTPRNELPFAGHPVLGSAFAIACALDTNAVRVETSVGVISLTAELSRGSRVAGRMQMEQPVPEWQDYDHADTLLAALGVDDPALPVHACRNGPLHVYVGLGSPQQVAAVTPDLPAVAGLGDLAVSCFARDRHMWVTRVFAPAHGIPEDAATGSAAGPLAVHLARHGQVRFGEEIEIRQGHAIGRPSVIYARADGTPEHVQRVEVSGSVVLVAEGQFSLS